MDFSRAFRTLTDDSEWLVKVLIGGVLVILSVLVIPAFIVAGYSLEVTRRSARGDDRLPAWDDWGGYFVRGALSVVIQLVYALPLLVIICCITAVSATVSGQSGQGGASNPSSGLSAFLVCLGCLAIPFGLFAAIFAPAANIRYAVSNDIGAAFNVGAVFALIRDHLGQFFMALLASIGLGLAAAAVSSILCGLPAPWLSFAVSVVAANLYGQVAQVASGTDTSLYAPAAPPSF